MSDPGAGARQARQELDHEEAARIIRLAQQIKEEEERGGSLSTLGAAAEETGLSARHVELAEHRLRTPRRRFSDRHGRRLTGLQLGARIWWAAGWLLIPLSALMVPILEGGSVEKLPAFAPFIYIGVGIVLQILAGHSRVDDEE